MALDLTNLGGFDWNKGSIGHIKKHNVTKEECEEVFLNQPLFLTADEWHSGNEKRFRVLGQTNTKRPITLIITIRNDKIRVITARDQSKQERRDYQQSGGETL